jgi:1-acyl-sn-glycerol-3-phosphate acyltransferase
MTKILFPIKSIVIDHLGNSDIPAYVSVLPAPPDALGGIELFEIPILGKLMDWYGVIWLHRGRADMRALCAAFLAYRSGAPILPIAITGTENENVYGYMKKFRRARVLLKVGKMFCLTEQATSGALSESKGRREALTEGTSQIIQALADLLPEKHQGAYSRS